MGNESSKTMTGPQRHVKLNKYVDDLEKINIEDSDNEEKCEPCYLSDVDRDETADAAADPDPKNLREAYRRVCPLEGIDAEALKINPMEFDYPFENIIMEGGGNKGLAYVGAIKCLQDMGLLKQIKRIGGTSAGALTAAMLAIGYTPDEILGFLSQDIESIFLDHSCGLLSLIPNLMKTFGWNPGHKIMEWFGMTIKEKTGSSDTTFYELYVSTGIELCMVVTNLNLMTAQYCHPKTTPDMPIRHALRMTMSIPGMFSAMEYEHHGQHDVFVDGGVLCNYPINCFDGWYLSMAHKDSFLHKLKPLKDLPRLMSPGQRFKATGPNKTIGFLLFDDTEKEVMRYRLEKRIGVLHPAKPTVETNLYQQREKKKKMKQKAEKEHKKIVNAVESFLDVLNKHNLDEDEYITKEELKEAFEDEDFPEKYREILFGKDCKLEKAFEILDKDGNGKIATFELIQFIEERGIRMQMRFVGYGRQDISSFFGFLLALQSTMFTNLKYVNVRDVDVERTVGINTGHLQTNDYVLADADKDFVIKRGYNATMSFLRYYAANNPDNVTRRKPIMTQNGQPNGIHNGQSNGIQNGKPNGINNGQPNGIHNGKANGIHNGEPNGIHDGKANGIQNGEPTVLQNGLIEGRMVS